MAIAVDTINPLEFAEQDPFMGFKSGMSLMSQFYQNKIAQAQAQYAQQQQAANLAQTQAQTNYLSQGLTPQSQAYANYINKGQLPQINAQTNLLSQLTPAQVLSANSQASINNVLANNATQYPNAYAPGLIGTVGQALYASNMKLNPDGTISPPGQENQYTANYSAPGTSQLPLPGSQQIGSNGTNTPLFASQLVNKIINPIGYQTQLSASEATAKKQAIDYQNFLDSASKVADNANNMINDAQDFKNNYQNATFKGPSLSEMPSKGLWTLLSPGHDFTPEQNVDSAATRIQADWAKQNFQQRQTNMDLGLAAMAKPTRAFTPDAAMTNINYIQQTAYRQKELPNFAQYVNSAYGIQNAPQISQLWHNYMSDKPVFDWKSGKALSQNVYSYPQYLTQVLGPPKNQPAPGSTGPENPQAISNQNNTSDNISIPKFTNPGDFRNWFKGLPADQQQQVASQLKGATS